MAHGKYFFIRSKLSGLVLDIQGGSCSPGNKVITYEKHGGDNQQWYQDRHTFTIRSKVDPDYVLEVADELVVNPFEHGNQNQNWSISGEYIANRFDSNRVFDISESNAEAGATIIAYSQHGGDNQLWDFDFEDARSFRLKSRMNGLVLDVAGADPSEGTEVCMWSQSDDNPDNQIWFEDENGVIRTKLNGYTLDGSGDKVTIAPYEPDNEHRQFAAHHDRVCSLRNRDKVLDIVGENADEGARVCVWDFHGNNNQLWDIEYL